MNENMNDVSLIYSVLCVCVCASVYFSSNVNEMSGFDNIVRSSHCEQIFVSKQVLDSYKIKWLVYIILTFNVNDTANPNYIANDNAKYLKKF